MLRAQNMITTVAIIVVCISYSVENSSDGKRELFSENKTRNRGSE